MRLKHFWAALLLCLTTLAAQAAGFDHSAWDTLLKKHVVMLRGDSASEVDYAGLMNNRAQLARYLAATSAVRREDFDRWSKAEQLAWLINSYNAWTVSLVLTGYPGISSIKDLGSFFQSPWKKAFIPLLGETRSLDDIEHGLIRGSGRYNDPRIHFAVNCASIGCPALRAEAYQPDRLDAQLEESARLFLADRARNRVQADSLRVSSIFKWYRADFEKGWRGAGSLAQFFSLYRQSLGLNDTAIRRLSSGEMDIQFLDYDWRLNKRS